MRLVIFFLTSALVVSNCKDISRHGIRQFPKGFRFGAATSSYQVEGGWNEDGKTESIWDYESHKVLSIIRDNSTGDISADSYHQYKRDVQMMRELGLDFYRFSISWNRILPTSFTNKINEAGVRYYNNLIDEMLKYNIQPVVTMYHFELPQKLQELGGWTNPYIVDYFADFARVLFKTFGDRVKTWITINEPSYVCSESYGQNYLAPRLNWKGIPEYLCAKNLLLAHAKVYHIYAAEFKPTQRGEVGITFGAVWFEPATPEHIAAADIAYQFTFGIYAHPIFSTKGDYPAIVKERIATKSAEQGFPRSRLPDLTPEEIRYIHGTADFFGFNHYGSCYTYTNNSVIGVYDVPSYQDDMEVGTYRLPEAQLGESDMIFYTPWSFRNALLKIKHEYNNPPVYITENGLASLGGLVDEDRVTYYRGYLNALLDAVEENCDVRMFTAWCLMDGFEWSSGYIEKFGLYEVNFEDLARTRTPRKSAFVYKEIIRSRQLDCAYQPNTTVMTIDEGH